jgi:hypothetical protein
VRRAISHPSRIIEVKKLSGSLLSITRSPRALLSRQRGFVQGAFLSGVHLSFVTWQGAPSRASSLGGAGQCPRLPPADRASNSTLRALCD